ncbi:unnamed protein product [Cochlearia groenlandica]
MSSDEIEFKSWREFLPCPPASVTTNKDDVVLKFVSEKCPSSSCSLKINNNKDDDSHLTKHESPLFSSGGYVWFVTSSFSFSYVEVKRFNSSKTVHGLSQVIPLETFNGYVLDGEGCCEFGAHVKVASPDFIVSDQNLPFHKFLFSFRDFSLLNKNGYVSKSFSMKERNWNLKMYPKGDPIACDRIYPWGEFMKSDGLSLYLYLDEREVLSRGQMMFVRKDLKALDPRGSNHKTSSSQGWVMPSNRAHSFSLSINLKTLEEICVDDEDTLNVEVEFEVLNEIISPLFT